MRQVSALGHKPKMRIKHDGDTDHRSPSLGAQQPQLQAREGEGEAHSGMAFESGIPSEAQASAAINPRASTRFNRSNGSSEWFGYLCCTLV